MSGDGLSRNRKREYEKKIDLRLIGEKLKN